MERTFSIPAVSVASSSFHLDNTHGQSCPRDPQSLLYLGQTPTAALDGKEFSASLLLQTMKIISVSASLQWEASSTY